MTAHTPPMRRRRSEPSVALAHDYITQRGGAERVVLSLARGFPAAPIHTTLFNAETTFPEFADHTIHTSWLNRFPILRRHHRLAFPLLAPTVSRMEIEADVVIASSSGWAHGIPLAPAAGPDTRKIVYCHTPARWLYQRDRYAGPGTPAMRRVATQITARALGPALRRWDRKAANTADVYIANSSMVRDSIREVYGIKAELVHPPVTVDPGTGQMSEVAGVTRPFVLCIARLMPYKNVDVVIDAVERLDMVDLVVVGSGPERENLTARTRGRTRLVGSVTDAEVRWLYHHSRGLVAASYEDFGLSPIEAAAFGRPVAALHRGGYLDSVMPGVNGVFFERPDPAVVAESIAELLATTWDEEKIRAHAAQFSEQRFQERMRAIVHATAGREFVDEAS